MSPLRSRYSTEESREQELLAARREVRTMLIVLLFLFHGELALTLLTEDLTQYNALERDLAVVNLYFGSSSVFGQLSAGELRLTLCPEYQIHKRMTLFDFIANLGGLFGLCLGFSIVSFFEVVFWFSIALYSKIYRY